MKTVQLPVLDNSRTEFGFQRVRCSCLVCTTYCRFLPGFLVPSDLSRMIPEGADPYEWAAQNLLASAGAQLMDRKTKIMRRVPTLVPARKADGQCKFFQNGHCSIHAISPFGCAFFGHQTDEHLRSLSGLYAIEQEPETGLYRSIWRFLNNQGIVSPDPIESRKKITHYLKSRARKDRR